MKDELNCLKCNKVLLFGKDKIVQTSERGLVGFYDKNCYDIVKLEKIANELT